MTHYPSTHKQNNYIDQQQFTTLDYLLNYCTINLGTPKKRGNEYRFPCPFANHTNPYHLTVYVKDAKGYYKCWSCGKAGNIFTLHAELNDIPSTKGKYFHQILRELQGTAFQQATHQHHFYTKSQNAPPHQGLTQAQIQALEEARATLSTNYPLCCKLGAELGISGTTIHTSSQFPQKHATLGVTPDNRLLFIYYDHDPIQDKYVPFMAKIRRFTDGSPSPFLKLTEKGTWQSYGDMTKREHARFIQVTKGSIKAPWGIQALSTNKKCFVLCEGESDTLAVYDAMLTYQEAYQTETIFCPDYLPIALGIPGVSAFKNHWLPLFQGKSIILCFDNDKAGKDAVNKLADNLRLHQAKVAVWQPQGQEKDCREILIKQGHINLAEQIFNALKKAN